MTGCKRETSRPARRGSPPSRRRPTPRRIVTDGNRSGSARRMKLLISAVERSYSKIARLSPLKSEESRGDPMRPQLRVVPPDLIVPILDEAKQILSRIGVEVRGTALR